MYEKYGKRLLDILFSLILLPLVLLVILLFGVLIKLEDRGPIFYCSERLGKHGKVFKMYKLRSMKVNAPDLRNPDGSTYNSDNDPRLTKIGRFLRITSLDELPQLFNVIKGDMSLIGPRPDLPEHMRYYEGAEIRKLEVLPGITGYNQAYYRNAAKWKDRLKNDLYYVDNISFYLDCKIFFKTIERIILMKGIYANPKSKKIEGEDDNELLTKT